MPRRQPDPALVARLRRTMHGAAGIDLDAHARHIAQEIERATKAFGHATRDLLRDLSPRRRKD